MSHGYLKELERQVKMLRVTIAELRAFKQSVRQLDPDVYDRAEDMAEIARHKNFGKAKDPN